MCACVGVHVWVCARAESVRGPFFFGSYVLATLGWGNSTDCSPLRSACTVASHSPRVGFVSSIELPGRTLAQPGDWDCRGELSLAW